MQNVFLSTFKLKYQKFKIIFYNLHCCCVNIMGIAVNV